MAKASQTKSTTLTFRKQIMHFMNDSISIEVILDFLINPNLSENSFAITVY